MYFICYKYRKKIRQELEYAFKYNFQESPVVIQHLTLGGKETLTDGVREVDFVIMIIPGRGYSLQKH